MKIKKEQTITVEGLQCDGCKVEDIQPVMTIGSLVEQAQADLQQRKEKGEDVNEISILDIAGHRNVRGIGLGVGPEEGHLCKACYRQALSEFMARHK